MKRLIAGIGLIVLVWLGFYMFTNRKAPKPVTDFASCVAAGNRVQESYPATCVTEAGESFRQEISEEIKP